MKRALSVACIVFISGFFEEFPVVAQGLAPLMDERFCADANGDGKVNISDPVTTLNSLFAGGRDPYCISQGVNIGEQLAALETSNASLMASLAAANDANALLTESSATQSARIAELEASLSAANDTNALLTQSNADLTANLAAANDANAVLSATNGELTNSLATANNENATLTASLATANDANAVLSATNGELTNSLATANNENATLTASLAAANVANDTLAAEVADVLEQLNAARVDIAVLTQTNQDLEADLADCMGMLGGCMDPLAVNHDPAAMADDGSCFYNCPEFDIGPAAAATREWVHTLAPLLIELEATVVGSTPSNILEGYLRLLRSAKTAVRDLEDRAEIACIIAEVKPPLVCGGVSVDGPQHVAWPVFECEGESVSELAHLAEEVRSLIRAVRSRVCDGLGGHAEECE